MPRREQFLLSDEAGPAARASNVTVIGAQWGDEGKGKIVDWCAATAGPHERFAAVVRFNGGHNAGHTLVAEGRRAVVSLVPSGVLTGTTGIIGNGVVLDPFALLDEIDRLRRDGHDVSPRTLRVAETVTLLLPVHVALDRLNNAGDIPLGTTGRGIGPAYEDKVGRRALRLCDLDDEAYARGRLGVLVRRANAVLQSEGGQVVDADEQWALVRDGARRLQPYRDRTADGLDQPNGGRRRMLFEGAQSVMLDIEHGTYPFVTSSSCVAAAAAASTALAPRDVGVVVGVAKAYLTRVGEGPFPTEDTGPAGELLFSRGREVGTNTGRRRRCGWMDAALLRQACRAGGIERLALTKLDVLDELPAIQIGIGYVLDGQRVNSLPPMVSAQARAVPVYETVDGWSSPTRGMRTLEDLPAAAVRYLRRLEELVGVPIMLVSTGPDRDETIRVGDVS
jgi:adenylosuccinate synthase